MLLYHELIFIKMKEHWRSFIQPWLQRGNHGVAGEAGRRGLRMYSFLPSYKIKTPLNKYIYSSHRKNKNLSSKERYKVRFPSTELVGPQGKTVE